MRRALALVAAAAAAFAAMSVNVLAGSAGDERDIRQALDAMTSAFNNHDESRAASLMTDDADYVNVQGSWSKGARQIAQFRRARFAGALSHASLHVLDVDIRFVRRDVALVHELHEIAGMIDESGKELPPHRELSLRVFVKQRGRWLVTAFQNTSVATAGSDLSPSSHSNIR